MLKKLFTENGWSKTAISSMLALALLLSPFQLLGATANAVTAPELHAEHQELELTDEQVVALGALADIRENFSGLVGFEGEYELTDDDTPISVIVVFNSSPADVQLIEAQVFGDGYGATTIEEAEANVEADQELFQDELDELLDVQPLSRFFTPSYEIEWQYRRAFNGVVVTVPANAVEEIAEFESVALVMPNETVSIPEPIAFEGDHERDPVGMRDARQTMNAHLLHDQGYRGEGVLVAVLDTGIDYYHPAFAGSFPTLEDMHERNPDNPFLGVWSGMPDVNLGPTNGEFPVPAVMPGYDYFFGRNFIRGNGWADWNDPMETSPGHPAGAPGTPAHDNYVNPAQTTSHGTHVAGTTLGRDSGGENSILGIAPEASMIAYRVLGPGGSGQLGAVIAGVNMTYYDNPDVVNMSLGGGGASPFVATSLAVNNIVLARPHIVFTNSQGNAGPGFSTMSAPSSASLAIGVSSLTVPGSVGLYADFPIDDFSRELGGTTHNVSASTILTHVHGNADAEWTWADGPNSHVVSALPAFSAGDDGDIRLFVLPTADPRTVGGSNSAATGGQTAVIGTGTAADFELLFDIYSEEELEGAWVLLSRGHTIADVGAQIYNFGLGGAISVTGQGTLGTGGSQQVHFGNAGNWPGYGLFLMVDHLLALQLLDEMPTLVEGADPANSPRETMTFQFTDFYRENMPLHVSGFSSRGPVLQTFEIKPDIGAQGQGVWSAVPRWTVNQEWEMDGDFPWQGAGNEAYYVHAYQPSSGTSMSAPALAGAAALMVQYSRENYGEAWSAEEIRTRMMNNAIILDYEYLGLGIFDMGAGQVDVYAATQNDTVVYATFPKVVNVPQAQLGDEGFHSTRTGSFSFGGSLNSFEATPNGYRTRTLIGTIENQADTAQTYEISHRFIQTGRLSQDPANTATLTFDQTTVTVPAGGAIDFEATMTLTDDAPLGHYEGFVVITQDGEEVAVLPFAAVAQNNQVVRDVFLGRSVISTNAYDPTGAELNLYFTPYAPLAFQTFVVNSEDLDVADLTDAMLIAAAAGEATDIEIGYVGTRLLQGTGNASRAVVLDESHADLVSEGDYLLVLRVLRQDPFVPNILTPYDTLFFPFAVDNDAPEINDVAVNGLPAANDEHVVLPPDADALVISGNVFDEWMATAIADGVTFDIWLDDAPYGPEVSLAHNLAVYVVAGEATADNQPVRATVDAEGHFEALLENVDLTTEQAVTIWAVDNYTAVPNWNITLGETTGWWSLINPFPGDSFFNGTFVTAIYPALTQFLSFGFFPVPDLQGASNVPLFQQHVWGGLNLAEHAFTIALSPYSNDATLSGLTVTPGALSPAFSPDVLDYRVELGFANSFVSLVATPNHAAARIVDVTAPRGVMVTRIANTNEFHLALLAVGDNEITVTVESEFGNTEVYTIVINQADLVIPGIPPIPGLPR
ncbi:MAG: S8 family serine peptidase [Turicibacter sp.]|nr:S8 family serine peptidase [Turicibacter sp.]